MTNELALESEYKDYSILDAYIKKSKFKRQSMGSHPHYTVEISGMKVWELYPILGKPSKIKAMTNRVEGMGKGLIVHLGIYANWPEERFDQAYIFTFVQRDDKGVIVYKTHFMACVNKCGDVVCGYQFSRNY